MTVQHETIQAPQHGQTQQDSEKSSAEFNSNQLASDRVGILLYHDGAWEASPNDARAAADREHSLTFYAALKAYPWAVVWSLAVSMSLIMEGYSTMLIGSFYAYPTFAYRFGQFDEDSETYQIPLPWQSAMGSGPQAAALITALLNGYIIHRWGYKPAFRLGVVLMTSFIFLSVFGMSVRIQVVGQILCGLVFYLTFGGISCVLKEVHTDSDSASIPWGIFATTGPAYSSELCPLPLRPYLTAFVNIGFATGQLINAGVLYGFLNCDDDWAWRIPFCIQWVWLPGLAIVALFMPESPWHFVRQGRFANAEKVIHRLVADDEKQYAKGHVAVMIRTNNLEKELAKGTTYLDCFKGTDRRRTEIALMAFLGQITCGAQFACSASYFYQQADLETHYIYLLNLAGTVVAFCGTIGGCVLMKHVGHRSLYLTGMVGMSTLLLAIGCLDIGEHTDGVNPVKWTQAGLCIVWLLVFSLSVGPAGWVIPAEVSSTRLRAQTFVLARNAYYLGQIVANVLQPYMINPLGWDWRGETSRFGRKSSRPYGPLTA